MTPEAQRIAIAEACGWRPLKSSPQIWYHDGLKRHAFPHGGLIHAQRMEKKLPCYEYLLPDYLNDLNAMHEAEKTLKGMQCQNYQLWLIGFARGEHFIANKTPDCYEFHVTAAQRAEAFLRTIGKWVD